MIETEVEVRQWGDSLAVIIPHKIAEKEHIHAKDRIHIRIDKETDLTDVFGMLKDKLTLNAQKFKDEARKGWE